jgi:hypothetical protein
MILRHISVNKAGKRGGSTLRGVGLHDDASRIAMFAPRPATVCRHLQRTSDESRRSILMRTFSSHFPCTASPQSLQVLPCLLKPHIDVFASQSECVDYC